MQTLAQFTASIPTLPTIQAPASTYDLPTLPIELWDQISYLNIYVYHTLALAIRGLERNLPLRKAHFAEYSEHRLYTVLSLNRRPYCDDRPAFSLDVYINNRSQVMDMWVNAERELHRTDGPALTCGNYEAHYLHGVWVSANQETDYNFVDHMIELDLRIGIQKFIESTNTPIDEVYCNMNTWEMTTAWSQFAYTFSHDVLYEINTHNLTKRSQIQALVWDLA